MQNYSSAPVFTVFHRFLVPAHRSIEDVKHPSDQSHHASNHGLALRQHKRDATQRSDLILDKSQHSNMLLFDKKDVIHQRRDAVQQTRDMIQKHDDSLRRSQKTISQLRGPILSQVSSTNEDEINSFTDSYESSAPCSPTRNESRKCKRGQNYLSPSLNLSKLEDDCSMDSSIGDRGERCKRRRMNSNDQTEQELKTPTATDRYRDREDSPVDKTVRCPICHCCLHRKTLEDHVLQELSDLQSRFACTVDSNQSEDISTSSASRNDLSLTFTSKTRYDIYLKIRRNRKNRSERSKRRRTTKYNGIDSTPSTFSGEINENTIFTDEETIDVIGLDEQAFVTASSYYK
jgi:hypothetical protein